MLPVRSPGRNPPVRYGEKDKRRLFNYLTRGTLTIVSLDTEL